MKGAAVRITRLHAGATEYIESKGGGGFGFGTDHRSVREGGGGRGLGENNTVGKKWRGGTPPLHPFINTGNIPLKHVF